MIVSKSLILEEERVKRGLTKTDLANQIGVNHSVIVRAEKAGNVSPKTAKAICDFFGMEFSQLFSIRRKT